MMKKFLTAVLCLIIVMMMVVSCNDAVTPTPDTPPTTDGGTTGDGGDSGTIVPLPEGLYADLNTPVKIVCPDAEETYYNKYITMLIKAVSEKTGVAMSAMTDFDKNNVSGVISNDNYEIIIGNTNRKEATLVEAPENGYAIKVVGKKVVIKGSSQYYTTIGVLYFINNCIGSKEESKLFTIDTNYSYSDTPRCEASAYIDVLEKTDTTFKLFSSTGEASDFKATGKTYKGKTIALTPTKVLTFGTYEDSKNQQTIAVMQGGCTDGKYFYFLLTNPGDGAKGDSDADETRVIKMDPKTKKIVTVGPIISVAHSNDLTYDAKYNRLVVAWCSVDATRMSYIDMETLRVTGSASFSEKFFAIDYDAVGERYVYSASQYAKNGYPIIISTVAKSATAQRKLGEFKGISMGYVAQGIHCDSKYIYYTASPNNSSKDTKDSIPDINIVNVFDYDGNYICTLTIDLPHEIEHIFWYDNSFWAGFNANDGKHLYKLSF
jgi:hypothetical protein